MPPPAGPGDLPPTQRAIGGPGSWRRWRAPSRRPSFWVFLADPLPGIRDGPGGSILRHRRNPAAPWRAGMGGLKTSWERQCPGIAAWVALGATQAHVGAKYGITRQRVGQIVREFPWVRQAVRDRLRSLDENNGRAGGKCQSSLRGDGGSSGEFRPLARPDRARWRRICDRRGAGSRRRRKGTRLAGPLAALAAASLAAAGGFPHPERGGKCHLWRWRRSAAAGDFEAVLAGGSAALCSSGRSGRRSWRPPGSTRPSGGCSDGL